MYSAVLKLYAAQLLGVVFSEKKYLFHTSIGHSRESVKCALWKTLVSAELGSHGDANSNFYFQGLFVQSFMEVLGGNKERNEDRIKCIKNTELIIIQYFFIAYP